MILRATRRQQDPISRAAPGVFLGYQGTGRILVYKDSSNRFRYTHHTVVDELQSAKDPGQQNPAARVLQGLLIDIPQHDALNEAINSLEITPSRWTSGSLSLVFIPTLDATSALGIAYA